MNFVIQQNRQSRLELIGSFARQVRPGQSAEECASVAVELEADSGRTILAHFLPGVDQVTSGDGQILTLWADHQEFHHLLAIAFKLTVLDIAVHADVFVVGR